MQNRPSSGAWTPTPRGTWPRWWTRWAGAGHRAVPATAAGYAAALGWMRSHGELVKVGVEGTGSYGAGLAGYLAGEGVEVVEVVEVIRPNRQARRRRGKSDAADAVAAALATLNGEASGRPKSRDGAVESIRALRVARRGAIKARTQAANQLRDLIVTAAGQIREQLAPLPVEQRAGLAARFRPGELTDPAEGAKAAMSAVARRHQALTAEIARLDAALDRIGQPGLRDPVKRWSRFRLATGCAFTTIGSGALALTRFSRFLAACDPQLNDPSAITRRSWRTTCRGCSPRGTRRPPGRCPCR